MLGTDIHTHKRVDTTPNTYKVNKPGVAQRGVTWAPHDSRPFVLPQLGLDRF